MHLDSTSNALHGHIAARNHALLHASHFLVAVRLTRAIHPFHIARVIASFLMGLSRLLPDPQHKLRLPNATVLPLRPQLLLHTPPPA
jgi:hypothetical protein